MELKNGLFWVYISINLGKITIKMIIKTITQVKIASYYRFY